MTIQANYSFLYTDLTASFVFVMTQNFIYDFRWLKQDLGEETQLEVNEYEFELQEIERPNKIKSELNKLLSINPRDPAIMKSSPRMLKRYVRSLITSASILLISNIIESLLRQRIV